MAAEALAAAPLAATPPAVARSRPTPLPPPAAHSPRPAPTSADRRGGTHALPAPPQPVALRQGESEVSCWLARGVLAEFIPLFREEAIERLEQLRALTDDDLRELGLKMGARLRLRNALAASSASTAQERGSVGGGAAPSDAEHVGGTAGGETVGVVEGEGRGKVGEEAEGEVGAEAVGYHSSASWGVRAVVVDKRLANWNDRWDGRVPAGGAHLPLDLTYPGLVRAHAAPPLFLCDDFLSPQECDDLIAICTPLVTRSKTDGGVSEARTSRSCHLERDIGAAPALLRKASRLTGKPTAEMETPQLARYERGQFYGPHHDAQDESLSARPHSVGSTNGGQRICTVLIYLNQPEEGGFTRFERLGIEVVPRRGRAVIFFPAFLDGRIDKRYLHEARPAVQTKYVCQIWIRQGVIDDGKPAGLGFALLSALRESR